MSPEYGRAGRQRLPVPSRARTARRLLVGVAVYLALALGLRQGYRIHGILIPLAVLAGVTLLVALRAATRSVDLYPDRMVVHGFWPRTIQRSEVHGFVCRQAAGIRGSACSVVVQDSTGLGNPICTVPGVLSAEVHAFVRALESWAGIDTAQARQVVETRDVTRLGEIAKRLEHWQPDK